MSNIPPVHNQALPVHYDEDEINLVDLWLVLVKRKLILAGVVVASAVAALLYVVVVPPSYQYSTSIEIGTRLNGTELSVMESPETVLAKVKESYIPLAQQDYLDQHPESKSVIKIDTRVPKGSQIIVLSSKGADADGDIHKALQQSVVDTLKKDHGRIVDVLRKETEILQHQAVAKLEELKDGNELIMARSKRLNDFAVLLAKQAEEARKDLLQVKNNRQKAVREATNEVKAMTLLMLDSEIRNYRELLAEIDERLHIETANSQDAIKKDLADNQRAQEAQQDDIAKLEIQLANLRETRALQPPMRSLEPVGPGKTLIILLSLVLGLMLGVFAAFFAEFLSRVKGQAKSVQNA
jgi:capsular polysaccharide biosynthesis protein